MALQQILSSEELYKSEHDRFVNLHYEFEEPEQLFSKLVNDVGLNKVQQFNDKWESALNFSQLNEKDQWRLSMLWYLFTQGQAESWGNLKKKLKLSDGTDNEKIMSLFQCACFIRSPGCDTSELTQADMLAVLQGSAPSAKKTKQEVQIIDWSVDIIQQGFYSEYRKHDLIVLPTLKMLQNFAEDWDNFKFKAPYTSIIGPTMSGKTRLLMELAKHVCVVYICIRPRDSTGQPPRSELADLMLPAQGLRLDMNVHYSRLLAAIFETVSDFFSAESVRNQTLQERLASWFQYSFQMKAPQLHFKRKVEEKMEKMKKEIPNDRLVRHLRGVVSKMSQNVGLEDSPLKVLLAIDEGSNLLDPMDQNEKIPYFRMFRRVLSHIPPFTGVFGVFVDTNSRVANFSPSRKVDPNARRDPSARIPSHGAGLFAPIYKFSTLDLFVSENPVSWTDLLDPARLYNYGCPFYGLFYNGALPQEEHNALRRTSYLAEVKLLCEQKNYTDNKLTQSQSFALLGSLMQTRLTLHSPIHSELVSSHAAHCLFIDQTRETIVSDYPPQFVYASAANNILEHHEDRWINCIAHLSSAVEKGLVALGDTGEMATRIILLRAIQKTKPIHMQTTPIPSGHSVRLIDFIKTLSGKDPHDLDFGSIKEADKKRLLDQGRIFFNHFTRIEYTPTDTDLLKFLYRGVAAQCKRGQRGFDELFTIYLEPESDSSKLDVKNISFCGIQTKNQERHVDWSHSSKWSKSYAGLQGINNPYLALLFSLKTRSSSPRPWTQPKSSSDTQRACYQFLGLDQIACLTPELRVALGKLINAMPEDLLKLHGENDPVTVEWVKQLNPVFYSKENRSVHDQTYSDSQDFQTSPAINKRKKSS